MDPSAELRARRDLGRALAALRDAAGYTQDTFAPLTGYSRSTLANVETGRQRAPRGFWIRCDSLLTAGGRLTAEHDRIEAARRDHQKAEAAETLGRGRPPGDDPTGTVHPGAIHSSSGEVAAWRADGVDHVAGLVDEAADEALAQAALASAGLDRDGVADLFEQLADVARGYADRHRWESFRRARRGRDLAHDLSARTRRPTDLIDAYLLASLSNALMAAAAFDLAQWSAAASMARAARTFADLSGNPSAIGWARGLLATLMNWHDRPDAAVQEIEAGLAARPDRASRYRLFCIAARAHAMRGDRASARDALQQAARFRPDDGRGRDLLHDEIGGEFRFDPARASACAGAVWLHLRDGTAAEGALNTALTTYTAVPLQERPTAPVHGAHADLAAARLLRHDLDAADEALAPVFDVPPEQRISVLSGRLAGVQILLRDPHWDRTPRARVLSERINDWLGSARALPGGSVS